MPKRYRRIGEIAKELGIQTSTLRHWEKEIPQIDPKKNNSGHRIYTIKDFEIIKLVKKYKDNGLTIAGIKSKLDETVPVDTPENFHNEMSSLISDLKSLVKNL